MNLKPYEDIRQYYEELRRTFNLTRRTFNLTADRPYTNTWNFKQTPARKGRHPCEKPEELISHIIETSIMKMMLLLICFVVLALCLNVVRK